MLGRNLARIGIETGSLRQVNWTPWILWLGAIGTVLWIGLNAQRTVVAGLRGYDLFLIFALFVVAVGLILYRLELGILAILFCSFFVRFSISTGSSANVPVSMLVSGFVVGVWVLSMLLRRRAKLEPGWYVTPTLLFILISILSVPYSWLILRPDIFGNGGTGRSGLGFSFVQVGGVALMILLPIVMIMTANILKSEKWFKVIFGMVIAVAIPEFLSRLGLFNLEFGGFLLRTGASYALWIVALTVGQAFFNTSLKVWQRSALLGIAGLWIYFALEHGTTWFSGWMPAAVAFMFLAFMRSRVLFLMVIVGALLYAGLRGEDYIMHIWDDAVAYDSNRFEIWQVIIFDLTLTKTNFFFGAGPAGYLPFYETYYPGNAWVSHNNYVDIFAEIGLVGFSIFMWMLYAIFRTGFSQRNDMPTPFLKGMNYGLLGGFVGTLFAMGLGDWHIPFVYNIGIPGFDFAVYGWLLTGAMLALQSLRVSQANADAK